MSSVADPQFSLHIHNVPDNIIVEIFDLLTTEDLLHSIPLVCRLWKRLQAVACRNVLSLFVAVSDYRARHWDKMFSIWWLTEQRWSDRTFDQVAIKSDRTFVFDQAACERLVAKFPNVRSLNIYGINIATEQLAWLLTRWSGVAQLVWIVPNQWMGLSNAKEYERFLELGDSEDSIDVAKATNLPGRGSDSLLRAIDSLSQLTTLVLFDTPIEIYSGIARLDRVISKLTTLYIPVRKQDHIPDFKLYLETASASLNSLGLCISHEGFLFHTAKFQKALSELLDRIVQSRHFSLHICSVQGNGPVCNGFFQTLTNLTHLDLNVGCFCQFSSVLTNITAGLRTRLESFRITTSFEDVLRCNQYVKFNSMVSDDDDDDQENRLQPPIVTRKDGSDNFLSLYQKEIFLRFFTDLTPENYEQKLGDKVMTKVDTLALSNMNIFRWEQFAYLRFVFPNLVTLSLENVELSLYRKPSEPTTGRSQLLWEHLRQFESLRKVYRNGTLALDLVKAVNDVEHRTAGIRQLFRKKLDAVIRESPFKRTPQFGTIVHEDEEENPDQDEEKDEEDEEDEDDSDFDADEDEEEEDESDYEENKENEVDDEDEEEEEDDDDVQDEDNGNDADDDSDEDEEEDDDLIYAKFLSKAVP